MVIIHDGQECDVALALIKQTDKETWFGKLIRINTKKNHVLAKKIKIIRVLY